MMETNNYTTNLQLVSQEYPDEKTSLQTKTKKLLEYFSPKDIWKIKGLIFACLVACFLYVTYLTHFDKYDWTGLSSIRWKSKGNATWIGNTYGH